jgi:hypothetical protein
MLETWVASHGVWGAVAFGVGLFLFTCGLFHLLWELSTRQLIKRIRKSKGG